MSHFFNRYSQLPSHFFSRVTPTPLKAPELIHCNLRLIAQLNLTLTEAELLDMVSGNALPTGCDPMAQKYTGHQFGYYNPDLGDGRGLLIGQVLDANQQQWDLHLKGAGQTPYSRRGDGRAVLRSTVREYLGSEALHALGISSTRSLAICRNQERVRREIMEPRAGYIRVAKTHVRFGHFEWLAQQQDTLSLTLLADYVIDTVYPELAHIAAEDKYGELLTKICQKTAIMIADWQAIGFCHGVMNSDNMSVAGETFDFGPYAFMDDLKIHYICNHSDTEGRYAYSQQPSIGLWNCQVLAAAFSNIISEQQLDEALNAYVETYNRSYLEKMRHKIGLLEPIEEDRDLIADMLILIDQSDLDFQHFFLNLAKVAAPNTPKTGVEACLNLEMVPDSKAWHLWLERYFIRQALELKPENSPAIIEQHTPKFILRNYINQQVIEATEQGDYTLLDRVFEALQTPFSVHPNLPKSYYEAPQHADQKSMALSCSS